MRSSLSSSTPPLSQGANKPSPFSQCNLTPVSPQTSINGEDTQPQLGFGWDFEYALEDRMRQKQHEVNARFQRYGRFGMLREEALFPTPDRFRRAYDELLEAIGNDRTPSLSPESMIADTRYPQRANATQRHLGPKATMKKVQNSCHHSGQSRILKQRQAKARKRSTHGMITRSKAAAMRIYESDLRDNIEP
ncbi:hypothetical protein V491_07930 [Pseudogymnoascus sp. VKM F-3775]|nr:hypothetical protein V491_07930 [Pseudogymnoascus sp. VKM F-3775]